MRVLLLAPVFLVGASCTEDRAAADAGAAAVSGGVPAAPPLVGTPAPAAPPPVGTLAPGPGPAQPAPVAAAPALAPPPGPAPGGGAPAIPCDRLASKAMLDAISGIATDVSAMPEPVPPGKVVVRCEHRARDVEQHFGYYVECGKAARKVYADLRRKLGSLARARRGPWRSGLEAPGTFFFLSEDRRCFGQVAGRMLLRRGGVGERIAAEVARNLRR